MDTGIKQNVLREIKSLAEKHNVEKVLLFGSRARGDFRKTSDIDLAVKGGAAAGFTVDLEDTSTLLEFDVVDLDKPVHSDLLKSIEKEGKVLYEKIR